MHPISRVAIRATVYGLLIPAVLLALLWLSIPWWVPPVAKQIAAAQDIQLDTLELERPNGSGITIQRLSGTLGLGSTDGIPETRFELTNLILEWRLAQLIETGRVRSAQIGNIQLDLTPEPPADEQPLELRIPASPLRQIPADSWQIRSLTARWRAPARTLLLSGELQARGADLRGLAELLIDKDRSIRAELAGEVGTEHRVTISSTESGVTTLLAELEETREAETADGKIPSSGKGHVHLDRLGEVLPLISEDIATLPSLQGQLSIQWEGLLAAEVDPEQPWQGFELSGFAQLDANASDIPDLRIRKSEVSAHVDFRLTGPKLHLASSLPVRVGGGSPLLDTHSAQLLGTQQPVYVMLESMEALDAEILLDERRINKLRGDFRLQVLDANTALLDQRLHLTDLNLNLESGEPHGTATLALPGKLKTLPDAGLPFPELDWNVRGSFAFAGPEIRYTADWPLVANGKVLIEGAAHPFAVKLQPDGPVSLTLPATGSLEDEPGPEDAGPEVQAAFSLDAKLSAPGRSKLPLSSAQLDTAGTLSMAGHRLEYLPSRPVQLVSTLLIDGNKAPLNASLSLSSPLRVDLTETPALRLAEATATIHTKISQLAGASAKDLPELRHGPIQLRFSKVLVKQNHQNINGTWKMNALESSIDSTRLGPFDLGGSFVLDQDQLGVDATLRPGQSASTLATAHLDYAMSSGIGSGRFKLNDLKFPGGLATIRKIISPIPGELELTGGRVQVQGTATEIPANVSAQVQLGVENLAGLWEEIELAGMSFKLPVRLVDGKIHALPVDFSLDRLDPGFPVRDIRMRIEATQAVSSNPLPPIRISNFSANLLGGKVSAPVIEIDPAQDENRFAVQVEGIQLRELLKLEQQQDVMGDGVLDGLLPVTLTREGISVDSGHLQARDPGGVLRYRANAAAKNLARTNEGMRIALEALKNFRYHLLRADVNYAPDGQLLLALKIRGQNPDMSQGHPVHLNVNVEENVLTLLRSLQVSDTVSSQVEKSIEKRRSQ